MDFKVGLNHLNEWISKKEGIAPPILTFDKDFIGGNCFSPSTKTINITSTDEYGKEISIREIYWIFLHEYRHYLQYSGKSNQINLEELEYRKTHVSSNAVFWIKMFLTFFLIAMVALIMSIGYQQNLISGIIGTSLFLGFNVINCIICYRCYYHFTYNNKYIELCHRMEADADNYANSWDFEISIARHIRYEQFQQILKISVMENFLNIILGDKHLLSHPTNSQRLEFARNHKDINSEYFDFINSILF